MSIVCEICNQEFESFQQKANHVRWKHKEEKYTLEGLERMKECTRASNLKRFGEKTIASETRICKCGTSFEVSYSPERAYKGRLTCSLKCWKSREFSEDTNRKRGETLKKTYQGNPELLKSVISRFTLSQRSSSKPERQLADALKLLGFKRHYVVRTPDIIFDVDIVSQDKKVWIESDGIWHFEKVHEGHNFEVTKMRDMIEESEAVKRGVLLIRVNNQNTSIDQQKDFILDCIKNWDSSTGIVKKLGF
jgi:very-short-patch-repair endonuclease